MTNRYDDIIRGAKRKYHPESELFFLSEKILEWYHNDEMGIVIIHGQQGYGKSVYAALACAEIYGHDIEKAEFFYDWNAVKTHIVWTPRQFIDLCKKKENGHIVKEKVIVWDDAAYWLNAMDYRDKLCIQASKIMEVARSRWGAIVFTCSDQRQILTKIRGIPHAYSIPIRKAPGTASRNSQYYKYNKDRRFARLHKSWCSEDMKKSGKKGIEGDLFDARMPGKYNPRYPCKYTKEGKFISYPQDKNGNIIYKDNITKEYTIQKKDEENKTNRPASYGFFSWYKPFRDSFCTRAFDEFDDAATKKGF